MENSTDHKEQDYTVYLVPQPIYYVANPSENIGKV